jgi:glycosyltransferase involved in cell wall biosynthesis
MITIGRLVARKATTQLVDVLAACPVRNAHLLIVGDGPDTQAIRRRAAELSVHDRVHLMGQVSDEDKYAALSAADLFISASQHEGFGLVFLEAMAFGLPVLCYDRGGQTDFLASGETGHVVRLNDKDALTRATTALLLDHGCRKKMGRRNLELVENYFIDTCARRYEELFEEVIARRASLATRNHAISSSS